jgi:hypothetical protein
MNLHKALADVTEEKLGADYISNKRSHRIFRIAIGLRSHFQCNNVPA